MFHLLLSPASIEDVLATAAAMYMCAMGAVLVVAVVLARFAHPQLPPETQETTSQVVTVEMTLEALEAAAEASRHFHSGV